MAWTRRIQVAATGAGALSQAAAQERKRMIVKGIKMEGTYKGEGVNNSGGEVQTQRNRMPYPSEVPRRN